MMWQVRRACSPGVTVTTITVTAETAQGAAAQWYVYTGSREAVTLEVVQMIDGRGPSPADWLCRGVTVHGTIMDASGRPV